MQKCNSKAKKIKKISTQVKSSQVKYIEVQLKVHKHPYIGMDCGIIRNFRYKTGG